MYIFVLLLLVATANAQLGLGGGGLSSSDYEAEADPGYFQEKFKLGVSTSSFWDKDFKGYPINLYGDYQLFDLPVFVYLSGDILNGTTIKNNYDNSGMKISGGAKYRFHLLDDKSMNLDFKLGYAYLNFNYSFPSDFKLIKRYHMIVAGVEFHWFTIRNQGDWLFADTKISVAAATPPAFFNKQEKLAIVEDNYPPIDYNAQYSYLDANLHQALVELPTDPLPVIGFNLGIKYYNQMNVFHADYNAGIWLSFFESKVEFWGVGYNYYSRGKMDPPSLYRHEITAYIFLDWFIKNHTKRVEQPEY
jgi:hypothetical protein